MVLATRASIKPNGVLKKIVPRPNYPPHCSPSPLSWILPIRYFSDESRCRAFLGRREFLSGTKQAKPTSFPGAGR